MKVGIVDDEIPSRQVIRNILKTYCPFADVVVEEGSVNRAVVSLNEKQPEVIFLDIELKGGTGFDVVKDLKYNPVVIFTTAYSQYALNAIKVRAFDYLLKPIQEEELVATINNSKKLLESIPGSRNFQEPELSFFSFSSLDGTRIIPCKDILFFESSGSYTYCVTNYDRSLISKHLGEVEKEIPEAIFFRTHHSFIVNLGKIEKVEFKRNGKIFLPGGHIVPVAQRKIKEFRTFLREGSATTD